jgi:hypothetical protein
VQGFVGEVRVEVGSPGKMRLEDGAGEAAVVGDGGDVERREGVWWRRGKGGKDCCSLLFGVELEVVEFFEFLFQFLEFLDFLLEVRVILGPFACPANLIEAAVAVFCALDVGVLVKSF